LFRHALSVFARARFPGSEHAFQASRWIVRRGPVPVGADALIILSVEELAVNQLREPFQHWVRTHRIPVSDGLLQDRLAFVSPPDDQPRSEATPAADAEAAREIWLQIQPELQELVRTALPEEATKAVSDKLDALRSDAIGTEKERFRDRIQEVRRAMRETTIAKLEKDRQRLLDQLKQLTLFESVASEKEAALRDLESELERRQSHYSELVTRLEGERERVLSQMLPKRYTLRGRVQVFPVTMEIRLPEAAN
jgi:hypothetical protein